jgi:hypothetical protein
MRPAHKTRSAKRKATGKDQTEADAAPARPAANGTAPPAGAIAGYEHADIQTKTPGQSVESLESRKTRTEGDRIEVFIA